MKIKSITQNQKSVYRLKLFLDSNLLTDLRDQKTNNLNLNLKTQKTENPKPENLKINYLRQQHLLLSVLLLDYPGHLPHPLLVGVGARPQVRDLGLQRQHNGPEHVRALLRLFNN